MSATIGSLILCLVLTVGNQLSGSIADTIKISRWLVCGPFSVGTREGITEVIDDPTQLKPVAGESLPSGLVLGGTAIWREVTADADGWFRTDYPDVQWDTIQNYYGISGLVAVGYAYAEFYSPRQARALAAATRIGSFLLNGKTYLGDIYGNNWFRTPVIIDSGINRVILRLSGYGDQQVRFMLLPVPAPLIPVTQDITAPDLIADSALTVWFGIPLLNTTAEMFNHVILKMKIDTFLIADTIIDRIPALGVKKPAIFVRVPALPYDTSGYKLVLTVKWADFELSETTLLRSRRINQPHKRTFVSRIDSSCQYYAILYPSNYDPAQNYGLILSLHGAGVEASGLAECFQPKDWAFVVCPTNRRPYGFDWQDWGRLDAIEVLKEACNSLPVDPDRIYLTGHSMGGHGTWHIGLTHPDLFAAIAPAAGWPSFPLYVPNFLQRSIIFAEPSKLAIREMAARPDNTPAFLENACNLPVFILHGSEDDNVPPIHGRTFALWLKSLGYEYVYKEVPGVKHWWNYPDGTVCVDDGQLMTFLKTRKRQNTPRYIRFRTADINHSGKAYWVRIDRVAVVGRDAFIEATLSDSTLKISTVNITQLTIDQKKLKIAGSRLRVKIDGQELDLPISGKDITLHRDKNGWHPGVCRKGSITSKKPGLYGPAKEVFFSPFAIVYGTRNPDLTPFLHHSAVQEGLRWWLIANGTTEVYADTELLPSNRNLVLLGSDEDNIQTARIGRSLPIRIKNGRMLFNHVDLGESLAAIVTYPNPLNPQQLVLCRFGTDSSATKLSLFWNLIGSGTAIPDFIIFDRRVRRFGWNGVRAAGFFSSDWQIEPASCFVEK
ncbi:MAG: prolyl oligopeptidase family serine peptidase [candidate division WOR-3 bacterium]